ncbi:MAG: adenylyltransferase/cytidyltransferase family protein [Ruminococcus sp.]|nr:adenylyltransferase/cytidyltransferase family protein [Ruminococcus sp.]
MSKKPYGLGILVGRFQTLHTGHEMMINKAIELCDEVGIFIGSSQEEGTYKNPFSYEVRKSLLYKIFGSKIKVFPLPDIGVGNNSKWGDYVLENVIKHFNKTPDLLVSGREERRSSWFEGENGSAVSELYIPKTIDISASQMRTHFINGDLMSWEKYTNPILWDEFGVLKELVINSKDNLESKSI